MLYTGLSEDAVIQEFYRLAERSSLPASSFLPRTLCTLETRLSTVIDLRSEDTLDLLGLSVHQITGASLAICQAIGEIASELAGGNPRPIGNRHLRCTGNIRVESEARLLR